MAGPASVSTLLLRNVPLFAALPEGQLTLLTRVVGRKSYPRNSTIINAGDPTDALYIVISGRLKVMMSDDEGREVILAILGQGEFFGEMGLIDEAPRSATVIAIEPCELLTINKMDFKKCLAENFEIGVGVMKGLVKRLREAGKKIGSLALMVVEIGLITPPGGMNVYIINSLAKDVPMSETFRGVVPFLISDALRVVLLVFFPVLSLWLVRLLAP